MKIIDINNQKDYVYPLGKNIFENSKIAYHGTNSYCSKNIEKYGWKDKNFPYDIEDIQNVLKICKNLKKINIEGYYYLYEFVNKNMFEIDSKINKIAYFCQNYWPARNYAANFAGEVIGYLLKVINKLLSCKIKHSDLESYKNKLRVLHNKYISLMSNQYSIVYVLRIKKEWFSNWREPSKLSKLGSVNLASIVDIVPSNIIYRINFKNGIERYMLNCCKVPLPWKNNW